MLIQQNITPNSSIRSQILSEADAKYNSTAKTQTLNSVQVGIKYEPTIKSIQVDTIQELTLIQPKKNTGQKQKMLQKGKQIPQISQPIQKQIHLVQPLNSLIKQTQNSEHQLTSPKFNIPTLNLNHQDFELLQSQKQYHELQNKQLQSQTQALTQQQNMKFIQNQKTQADYSNQFATFQQHSQIQVNYFVESPHEFRNLVDSDELKSCNKKIVGQNEEMAMDFESPEFLVKKKLQENLQNMFGKIQQNKNAIKIDDAQQDQIQQSFLEIDQDLSQIKSENKNHLNFDESCSFINDESDCQIQNGIKNSQILKLDLGQYQPMSHKNNDQDYNSNQYLIQTPNQSFNPNQSLIQTPNQDFNKNQSFDFNIQLTKYSKLEMVQRQPTFNVEQTLNHDFNEDQSLIKYIPSRSQSLIKFGISGQNSDFDINQSLVNLARSPNETNYFNANTSPIKIDIPNENQYQIDSSIHQPFRTPVFQNHTSIQTKFIKQKTKSEYQNLKKLIKNLEFDFTKFRSQKRRKYLEKYEIVEYSSFSYQKEEGTDEQLILKQIKKIHKSDLSECNKQMTKLNQINKSHSLAISYAFFMLYQIIQISHFASVFTMSPMAFIDCQNGFTTVYYYVVLLNQLLYLLIDLVFIRIYLQKKEKQQVFLQKKRKYFEIILDIFDQLILGQVQLLNIQADFAFLIISYNMGFENYFLIGCIFYSFSNFPKCLNWLKNIPLFLRLYKENAMPRIGLLNQVSEENKQIREIKLAYSLMEIRGLYFCLDYTWFGTCKLQLIFYYYQIIFQEIPQFILQLSFLLKTDCGQEYVSQIIYISLLAKLTSFFFGFINKLISFIKVLYQLFDIKRQVEVVINEEILQTYGFQCLQDSIKQFKNLQMVKVSGTDSQYFTFTEFRVEELSKLFEPIRDKFQIEFFEIDRCCFENRSCLTEAENLFQKLLLKKRNLRKSLKYLMIQKSQLCDGFIELCLVNYLTQNQNLKRFSFIFNNDSQSKKNPQKYPLSMENISKGFENGQKHLFLNLQNTYGQDEEQLDLQAPNQEIVSLYGVVDDFELMLLLEKATSHPNLEIIQIVQPVYDQEDHQLKKQKQEVHINEKQLMHGQLIVEQEKISLSTQKEMFYKRKDEREKIYKNIGINLTTDFDNKICPLRRLEIRFLPLDPLFIKSLFQSLAKNLVLQELILTDDCLQHCSIIEMQLLADFIKLNQHSNIVLIDLSRNIHILDDHEEVHETLINAFIEQQRNTIETKSLQYREKPKMKKTYLETFIFTTNSDDVIEMYKEIYSQAQGKENLKVIINGIDFQKIYSS